MSYRMTARLRRPYARYVQARRLSFLTIADGASRAISTGERRMNGWRQYYTGFMTTIGAGRTSVRGVCSGSVPPRALSKTKARQLRFAQEAEASALVKRSALDLRRDVGHDLAAAPLEEIWLVV